MGYTLLALDERRIAEFMKHNKYPQGQKQKTPGAPGPGTAANRKQNEADFTPSPDEVARKAYFTYVNQGSLPGHEVQHWLQAEAELTAERKRTRAHGFHIHKRTSRKLPK